LALSGAKKKNDRQGQEKTLQIVLPILSIATFAQALVPHYLCLFPLKIAMGIFTGGLIPTLYTILNKESSEHTQGLVMGCGSSATMLGNLIGPILCSCTASQLGMPLSFAISGGLLGLVYVYIMSTNHR